MSTAAYSLIDMNNSIGIVIPARLDSIRLPRKLMYEFNKLPMLEHVRRRALMNSHGIEVVVVSGDKEILELINAHGGKAIQTKGNHMNGLSRIGEVADQLGWDKFIVLQGDEILVLPRHLDEMIEATSNSINFTALNSICKLSSVDELADPSVVKCLLNQVGDIITLFRGQPLISPIDIQLKLVMKICGLFSISLTTLKQIIEAESTPLESSESMEQMKLIELQIRLATVILDASFPSINLSKDVELVNYILANSAEQQNLLNDVLNF